MLGNDPRLRLLRAMHRGGEVRAGDLATAVGMIQQAVSNQLQRLVDKVLCATRREGAGIYYRIVDPCVPSLLDFGSCLLETPEMAALRVRRVDFLRKRLTVAESATEVGGTVRFGTPETHQQRTVPIPAVLVEPLSRRCQGKGRDGLVLTSPGGAVLRSGNSRGGSSTRRPRRPGSRTSARTTSGTPPRACWWPAARTSRRSSGCSVTPPQR